MSTAGLLPEEIAAASPAGLAHVMTEGRWKPFDHLLKVDEYLLKVATGEIKRLIIEIPVRHGKALALNTPVPTPTGWSTIGDLQVGDYVLDYEGSATRVIAKSPVWTNRDCYAVCTDDGDRIVADAEHEWRVILDARCPAHDHTTADLAQRNGQAPIVELATPKACISPDHDLPIEPYTLGIWLGDGTSAHATVTAGDEDRDEIRRYIHEEGYETTDRATYATFGVLGIQSQLRGLELLGNKHIPPAYLRASVTQRRRLLWGLIDSDGHVSPDGQVEFCSTNRLLADGVRELIFSLGHKASLIEGRATWDGRDHGPKYRVMFYMHGAAHLQRKRLRTRGGIRAQRRYLTFEKVDPQPTQCIQVDAPSALFLAGRSMTPTHNSELVSHYFPAWWLGRKPRDQVMLCSYNDNFARGWGRKARDTLSEVGPRVFGVAVAEQPAAADYWFVHDYGGVMAAAGVGGAITGKGANLLLIDDPVKNAEEANSEVYRDKVWEWWESTAKTRLQPGGCVVLVMARWHEDDLSGRIQARQGSAEPWTVLRLPALAEKNDPMGREEGEALCPEMWPLDVLEGVKKESPYAFASLYQQSPAPPEGLIFQRKDFREWKVSAEEDDGSPAIYELKARDGEEKRYVVVSTCTTFQTVDVAASKKTTADWTVVSTWAATPEKDLLLLDSERQHFETLHVAEFLQRMNDKHDNPPMWIETFGAGDVPYKQMVRAGYPVRQLKAAEGTRNDKIKRAQAAIAAYGNHKIFHPMGGDFIGDFEAELAMFPNGHDDQVDTVSYAARLLPNIGAQHSVRKPKSTTIMGNLLGRKW